MKRAHLIVLAMLMLVAGAFAGWRMLAITQADRWAQDDPARALRWLPAHPQALLAMAERELVRGDLSAARAHARHLLAVAPLEGRGFRVLAEAAEQAGDDAQALAMYRIAARRIPRDARTRVWLANHYLLGRDYPSALAQLDVLLRVSPTHREAVRGLLLLRAAEPAFAEALAAALARRPEWRPGLLTALLNAEDASAADKVIAALQRHGGLDETESGQWIEQLQRRGRWGEAYGRWAGREIDQGRPLELVNNGRFEHEITSQGFDWRIRRVPGVSLEMVAAGNGRGLSAHAVFRGRAVPQLNLEQALLLAPGRYRFSARMRANGLRSDAGLEWTVTCVGKNQGLVVSERVEGSFEWRSLSGEVLVPDVDCPAQWLRLENPAPLGTAQQTWGELWIDDVVLQPKV